MRVDVTYGLLQQFTILLRAEMLVEFRHIRKSESSHAGNVRASHGSSLHIAVSLSVAGFRGQCRQDAAFRTVIIGISAWSGDVGAGAEIGIGGRSEVTTYGSHRDEIPVSSRI